MRPNQWYKNLVIFVALLFSNNLFNKTALLYSISAFIIFCALSGSVYIINDLIDRKKDSLHPIKKNRPIASGKLGHAHALVFMIFILGGSLVLSFLIGELFGYISLTYFFLFLVYSFILKHIVIVDVITIALGFVIRAISGAIAIDVIFSPWLVVCSFLLALFLALGKRRHELTLLGNNATNHRPILNGYSVTMLEQMISSTTAALIISYSIYTFLTDDPYMMLTIPFAVYGLFRYLQIIHISEFGSEPELLFKDKGMLANFTVWSVSVVIILYLPIR